MSTQNNPVSAFIDSMRQTGFYTEWVRTAALVVDSDYVSDHLHGETIEKCRKNAERVHYRSGSYVQTSSKLIFIFTVWVDKDCDERNIDYTNELPRLLESLDKTESDLESTSAKLIDEMGLDNVYYWRLVFKCRQETH